MTNNNLNNLRNSLFSNPSNNGFTNWFFKFGLKTPVLIIITVLTIILRLSGDTLLFLVDRLDSPFGLIWKLVTSSVLLITLFFIYFKDFLLIPKHELGYEFNKEGIAHSVVEYFIELRRILILTGILIALLVILETTNIRLGELDNLIGILLSEIISIYSLITSIALMRFLYKWLNLRKHKHTKLYINILRNGLQYFFLVELITNIFKILNNSLVEILTLVIIIFMLIIMFLVSKKNTWIVLLTKRNKLKLLWQTIAGIILCLLGGNLGITATSSLHKSLLIFLPGTAAFVGIILLFAAIYYLRLFFAVIVSLPTTGIVERRTTELSTLTELNKLITETINYDKLLETVTELAMRAIGGIGAWTEIYNADGKFHFKTGIGNLYGGNSHGSNGEKGLIITTKNIEAGIIEKFDRLGVLREKLKEMDKGIIVESLKEEVGLKELVWDTIPGAKGLIAVPLFAGDEKIGTLAVLSDTEYEYEADDIKVLTAFSDNVSVAFENARLFRDSVEKERYRRELLLAREIEEKLLPRELPVISGYSLAAFSQPAEEVGGDYYDVVKLKGGETCLLIGDVSGKGISAAFLMAQLKGVVLAVAPVSNGASDILKRINSTLFGAMDRQMYITLCSLVINNTPIHLIPKLVLGNEINIGSISLARAGHMPIIYICSKTRALDQVENKISLITPKGIGIGLAGDAIFEENIEELNIEAKAGDKWILFTDGVNELKNEQNEEFGLNSLKQILNKTAENSVENILQEIKNRLKIFSGHVRQHDDMTIVALSYNGNINGTLH